jgi:antitoxin ParD1/3/4
MPASYALGTRFERFVDRLVKSGRYNSKSEVVREGLRLLLNREQERDAKIAALREAFRRGEESGSPIPAEEAFDRLEAKYAPMAARRKR